MLITREDRLDSLSSVHQLADQKGKEERAEAEDIRFESAWMPFQNLRRYKTGCATLKAYLRSIIAPTCHSEVGDAHVESLFFKHKDVVWLQVSVHNSFSMHQVYR